MDNRPEWLDPSFEVQLTKIGALKNGELNREWFDEFVRQSRPFIEAAKVEMAREMVEEIEEILNDD